jgi:ABC-type molybdate transport system ATPase subunit
VDKLPTEAPRGLSVRSSLRGVVARLVPDEDHAMLVEIDAGGVLRVARVTAGAASDRARCGPACRCGCWSRP